MDFKNFTESYWELFLAHLCKFHPLEHSFIDRFHEELDWAALSENTAIAWDKDFIGKWEGKWLWHQLAMNPAIIWNDDMIKTFKKRLDTYYLVRNVNLPLSDEFIQKHLKSSHFVENNNYLTPELRKKYHDRLMPFPKPATEPDKLTELNVHELTEILDHWEYSEAQPVLYEEYILPNLTSVEALFENRFSSTQRWYFISAINIDIHGLTPGYKGDPNNPFESYDYNRNISNHPESVVLKFIPDSNSEGPDRMFEVLRSNTIGRYAALLLSENIRAVLSKFTLPKHKYFQAEVKPKKVKSNVSYFVLQFDFDTIYNDIDFQQTDFKFRRKTFSSHTGWRAIRQKVSSLQELAEESKTLRSSTDKISTFIEILPTRFTIKSNFDVYTVDNRIIVNEFVKEALESNFPNQINFRSAQLLNICTEPKDYERKRSRTISFSTRNDLFSVPEVEQHYIAKKDRLERQSVQVDPSLIQADEFTAIQLKLNVIIPDNLKRFLKSNSALGEYSILAIDRFYQQNEYSSTNPESFKAVIVGDNGIGDSIGVILEKDDDYRLQNVIYEFLHETGEIHKYHLQIK
jgi:hypothetical protein